MIKTPNNYFKDGSIHVRFKNNSLFYALKSLYLQRFSNKPQTGHMKISIVIPIYNKEEYVEACFESLLKQDFDSFEIVAVDDGSTDRSGEICDCMEERDSRIRVFHTPNSGVTAARRKGVEEAQGKYIMFVDSDDQLPPHAMRTLYDAIEKTKADEVIGTFKTQEGVSSPVVHQGFTPVEPLIKAIIMSKNRFPVIWGIIFRCEMLKNVLDTPRDIIEGEDKLMQIKVLMKQPKVFFIPQQVYCYTLGTPNSRHHTIERERYYDELLLQALGHHATDFCHALTLHKLKEYERFILDGMFDVREAYYKTAIGKLPATIPFYDRLVFALPPVMARPIIRLYRMIINMKQKGL